MCARGWRQTVENKFSEEYKQKTVEYWYNHKKVEDDIKSGTYTHIALADSKVVGVIGGGKTGPELGEVFVFYVDEHYRYKGIGKKLLEAITKEQLKWGIKRQWVSVQEDNQLGIPFYEARGFTFEKKKTTQTETGEKQISLRYWRAIP
nr:GNAT family N-acetyltransferase [Salinibacillus kushneri]